MSHINDLIDGGFWPLQHHEPDMDLALRYVRYAVRIEDRGELGQYILSDATAGDVVGGLMWPAEDAPTPAPQRHPDAKEPLRDFPGWAFAWPAITTEATPDKGADQTTRERGAPGERGENQTSIRPILDEELGGDERYIEINAEALDPVPKGTRGIALAATNEHRQIELFLPTEHRLVAVHHAGDPRVASIVYDLDGDSEPDDDRKARLHSMMRVVRPVDGCVPFRPIEDSNSLAWQLGEAGRDKLPGRGLVADGEAIALAPVADPVPETPPAGATVARERSGVAGETRERDGDGGGSSTVAPVQILGAASARVGGPLDVGDAGDQHQLSTTMDGEAINSLHLSTLALFRGDGGDAPLAFQPTPYSHPKPQPMRARVHLRIDKTSQHEWACGARGGLWRWEAETPIYSPPFTPTGDGLRDPIPPTSPPFPGSSLIGDPTLPLTDGLVFGAGHSPAAGLPDQVLTIAPSAGASLAASLPAESPSVAFRPREGADGHEATSAMLLPLVSPVLLGRPQTPDIGHRDLRRDSNPGGDEIIDHDREAPITARLEAFGASTAGEFDYYAHDEVSPGSGQGGGGLGGPATPSSGRHVGGTGPGGMAFLPPRVDMADPIVTERPETYLAIHPDVVLAHGVPDGADGTVKDGWRITLDPFNGRLTSLPVDAAGAVDSAREQLIEGYLRIGPSDLSRNPVLRFGIVGGAELSSNIGASRLEINQGLAVGTSIPGGELVYNPFAATFGVFGAAAGQATVVALTDSTGGAANDTLVAVAGSGADAAINDNLADLVRKVNEIRTALVGFGLLA